jgi:hypothetical protein
MIDQLASFSGVSRRSARRADFAAAGTLFFSFPEVADVPVFAPLFAGFPLLLAGVPFPAFLLFFPTRPGDFGPFAADAVGFPWGVRWGALAGWAAMLAWRAAHSLGKTTPSGERPESLHAAAFFAAP